MKRITILLVVAAAMATLAVAAANACDEGPPTANLIATAQVKAALRHAFLAADPSLSPAEVAGPVVGRTYYGAYYGARYAVATFVVPGRRADPAIFGADAQGRWALMRITHGGICRGVLPPELIHTWWLVHWRGGCYVEP